MARFVHWVLDIAFREDESRVRLGHAGENLAVLRHIGLNLLHQEQSSCVGIHAKRLKAGWDNRYLLHVLGGVNEMRLPRIIVYIVELSPEKWYTRMNIAKGSFEKLQPLKKET